MAQVLTPPQTGSPFGPRSLSRSTSQTSLSRVGQDAAISINATSSSTFATAAQCSPSDSKPTASIPSSAPSSPRLLHQDYASSQPSLLSTPSSSLSLDDEYCEQDDSTLNYPTYHIQPSNTTTTHTFTTTQANGTVRGSTKQVKGARPKLTSMPYFADLPEVPLRQNPSFVSMGDDASVKKEPSRHVDYLSHSWREEDIWSSWQYIVARRDTLENVERLENASWRTWAKSQRRLKTVSPEKLNWMKDHDVTWLYGPLQSKDPNAINPDSPTARSRLSRINSFVHKKPILKRRNISEAMLQRSLSNSTLVRQAVDCIASQEKATTPTRGILNNSSSSRFHEHVSTPAPSPHDSMDYFSSSSNSDCTSVNLDPTTPGTEKRHIHFNNKVEQCIAVDKSDDTEDNGSAIHEDSDSDDGIVMHTANNKERKLSSIGGSTRTSFSGDNQPKSIAMLPSTTLKFRGDTPEPPERSSTPRPPGSSWGSERKLAHSSSSETLKPTRPSNNFLIDDDDDDPDIGWQPSFTATGVPLEYYDEDDEELEARGMRRTPSGMFMPYSEAEGDPEGSGIFGRVVDTVNTARDIAHVIWNVGWRR